jgi:hypothetical protein
MEKESFGMLMVIFLKVNGKMIKQMVMVNIYMLMEQNMKVDFNNIIIKYYYKIYLINF